MKDIRIPLKPAADERLNYEPVTTLPTFTWRDPAPPPPPKHERIFPADGR